MAGSETFPYAERRNLSHSCDVPDSEVICSTLGFFGSESLPYADRLCVSHALYVRNLTDRSLASSATGTPWYHDEVRSRKARGDEVKPLDSRTSDPRNLRRCFLIRFTCSPRVSDHHHTAFALYQATTSFGSAILEQRCNNTSDMRQRGEE